jgi:hypothetical protein
MQYKKQKKGVNRMKIRVIKPFTDKKFNDEILRKVGEIIDTNDESFRCDEELAKTRIKHKVCEEVKEEKKETKGKKAKTE